MIYPNASTSQIRKWNLEEINTQDVEVKLPSEIENLLELENVVVIVNGVVIQNKAELLQVQTLDYYQEKNNDLLNGFDKEILLVIPESKSGLINVVNYVSGSNLSLKLVYKVESKDIKINELIKTNSIDKVKINTVIDIASDDAKVVVTSVSNVKLAKTYQRYDLYTTKENANLTFNYGGLNESDSFVEVFGKTKALGSTINVNNVMLANNDEYSNLLINLVNSAKNTNTDMKNYVVSGGSAKLIVDGIGKIEKGMSKSSAYQTTRGLIIGDNSECHTNPLLLIDEYDVQAGHGATVGKIDDEHLYYLMSRGLTKLEASTLIINGYVNYLYEYIYSDLLKGIIQGVITTKLK